VDLSYNQISGDVPDETGQLSALTHLSLNGNRFSGAFPAAIASCIALRHCYLQHNKLAGGVPMCLRATACPAVLLPAAQPTHRHRGVEEADEVALVLCLALF
jgi:hypothetical protein